MQGIYLRSLIAVIGIVAFVLIEMLLPQMAGSDPARPAATLDVGHRLR